MRLRAWFWTYIHKKYGCADVTHFSVPMRYYSNFSNHFWLYNAAGEVTAGTRTLLGAIIKSIRSGLYIVKINETPKY